MVVVGEVGGSFGGGFLSFFPQSFLMVVVLFRDQIQGPIQGHPIQGHQGHQFEAGTPIRSRDTNSKLGIPASLIRAPSES